MKPVKQSLLLVPMIAVSTTAFAQAGTVGTLDIVNDALSPSTPLHSNGGLDPDNYTKSRSNEVSVALRSRAVDGIGQPSVAPQESGTVTGLKTYNVGANGQFTVDFDFVPKGQDEVAANNYFVKLELDNDSSKDANFTPMNTFQGFVFDSDENDELLDSVRSAVPREDSSWDDGDSIAIYEAFGISGPPISSTRNGEDVDFAWTNGLDDNDLPEYVLSNSWNAQWDFSNFSLLGDDFGGDLPAGLYDIRLTAFEDYKSVGNGNDLASVTITAKVVPSPTAAFGGLMLLGGLALRRRRRVV